jgi:putative transposase
MVAFIDQHRGTYGVEPIFAVLPIAPSTYFLHKAQQQDLTTRSTRRQGDDELRAAIQRGWDDNHQVYGPRKIWKQLRREGHRVARCTVERLMRTLGLRGTGVAHHHACRRRGPPRRSRRAALRGDPTESALSRRLHVRRGLARVRLRRLRRRRLRPPHRRVARVGLAATDFVLDALEQAISDRRGTTVTELVQHSDRGSGSEGALGAVLPEPGEQPPGGGRRGRHVLRRDRVESYFRRSTERAFSSGRVTDSWCRS